MKIDANRIVVPTDLAPVIDAFWYSTSEGEAHEISPVQCCLPNGNVEFIVHTTPQRLTANMPAGQVFLPEAYVIGIKKEPLYYTFPAGASMFGISIRPEVFTQLFNCSINPIARHYAEANSFIGPQVGAYIRQLKVAKNDAQRSAAAVGFLRNFLAGREQQSTNHQYLNKVMAQIRQASFTPRMRDLEEQVFLSKRQLQRVFQDKIGLSAKTYGRIIRFWQAFEYVQRHPKANWIDITYHFGYADQSHFIRDFREFTGSKPSTFMSEFTSQTFYSVFLSPQ
ncbi:MAG: AraC family transcriptional regulator [Lewinellaceae bacterium]|nr:AraC family transcriptional regulator [Lewinellaceae bacterium]